MKSALVKVLLALLLLTNAAFAAAGQVLARANVTAMKLKAFKYYYIPSKDIGLSGIVAKPTPELLKLQADLIAAVTPFTVETGASTSFVTTPDDPVIGPFLIQYVSAFVPDKSLGRSDLSRRGLWPPIKSIWPL